MTSRDSVIWDNDAKYFFYANGILARTELGDNQVQGMDYAYTLQGWVKGVNSNLLKPNTDIGHDGLASNMNSGFAHDAFGYSLNRYQGDYKPIGTIVSTDTAFASTIVSPTPDLIKARHDLFNGNISSMVTSIIAPTTYAKTSGTAVPLPQGTAYRFDQLNRIVEMQAYQNLNASTNAWNNGSIYTGLYNNKFTYDENGNILTQLRKDSASNKLDNLTYHYAKDGNGRTFQNRLYHVNDSVSSTYSSTDIDDQGAYIINPKSSIAQSNTVTAVQLVRGFLHFPQFFSSGDSEGKTPLSRRFAFY